MRCLLVVVVALSASRVIAQETSYEIAVRYPHVWRGISLRDFPILSLSATSRHHSGFTFQTWVGIDLADDNGRQGDIQEVDLDLSYQWQGEDAALAVGYVELIFPQGIDNTGELYAKVFSKRHGRPRLEVYYNVDLLRDVFALFSFGEAWLMTNSWTASLRATVAYSGKEYAAFFGGSHSGLHHWGLSGDLDYQFASYGLKLRLGYSDRFDERVLPTQKNRVWGGVFWTLSR